MPYASFDFVGADKIPRTGPALIVFNHRSYFDPTAVALLLTKSNRPIRFLGKREVFNTPLLGTITQGMGGIPVDRATGSDEPLRAAAQALEGGEMVAMAPQGTIPRGPAFFDPELKGRWGAAKLAAMSGAPVIPVGLWGTEKVWPRSSRLPKLSMSRPMVQVKVGNPVELGLTDADTDTRAIMSALSALLPKEARRKHQPSDEELALTYPPGYNGDVSQEHERRPGTNT